jgi:hypothetical protein
MVELARATDKIAAPASRIWEVLTDFSHPQRLAKSIERCETNGSGIGAVRTVTARGMTIHERLEVLSPAEYRLSYRALPSGHMPAPGLSSYLATVILRPLTNSLTEIEWWSEGDFDATVVDETASVPMANFVALYERAIENLRTEAGAQG